MSNDVRDEIIYPTPNCSGCTIDWSLGIDKYIVISLYTL